MAVETVFHYPITTAAFALIAIGALILTLTVWATITGRADGREKAVDNCAFVGAMVLLGAVFLFIGIGGGQVTNKNQSQATSQEK